MAEPLPPIEPDTGNFFTRKIGGLPGWGWLAITVGAVAVAAIWIRSRKSPASPSAPTVDPNAAGLDTGQYEALLALLRDIQGKPSTDVDTPAPTPAPSPSPSPAPGVIPKPPGAIPAVKKPSMPVRSSIPSAASPISGARFTQIGRHKVLVPFRVPPKSGATGVKTGQKRAL